MAGGSGELHGTIKPDGNHVWNSSEIIEDSAEALRPKWELNKVRLSWDLTESLAWLDCLET